MARTRAVVLQAAARVVAERGTRRASMSDVAAAAGVAKGTLYNHFRTKDDVWAALLESELDALVVECRGLPLEFALSHAAQRISAHPALRRIAADEPTVVTLLAAPDPDSRCWRMATAAVADALTAAGRDPAATDLVLRWLASHLLARDAGSAGATAALLAAGLPATVTVSSPS